MVLVYLEPPMDIMYRRDDKKKNIFPLSATHPPPRKTTWGNNTLDPKNVVTGGDVFPKCAGGGGSVVVSDLLSAIFSSNSEIKEAGKIGTWCMHVFFVYVLSIQSR